VVAGRLVTAVVATLHLAALVAPALVLAVAARKGGIPRWHGLDLVIASALLGSVHATVVAVRLRRTLQSGADVLVVMLARTVALAVLALAATLLLTAVLEGAATQHATLVNRGWPVVLLWVGVQAAAVALAEFVHTHVRRWLAATDDAQPAVTQASVSRDAGAEPRTTAALRSRRPPRP
jgi:hypothetical protein